MFWGTYLGEWGRSGGSFSLSLCLEITTHFPKDPLWLIVPFGCLLVTVHYGCLTRDSWQPLGWRLPPLGAPRSGWWYGRVDWPIQAMLENSLWCSWYGALVLDILELAWCCIFWILKWNMQSVPSGVSWGHLTGLLCLDGQGIQCTPLGDTIHIVDMVGLIFL